MAHSDYVETNTFNPWHYLSLLERKPGALRNGAPFQQWALPPSVQSIRDLLLKKPKGDKQFVALLQSISLYGSEVVNVACERALTDQVISADYILNIIGRGHPSPVPALVQTAEQLTLESEPTSNCARYNQLLTGESHVL